MNAIVAWIMCILAIVILGVLLDLMLSGTRMHKLIQTVFATVTILVIITPLPSLVKSGFGSGQSIFNTNIELDRGYLQMAEQTKTTALELGVVSALKDDGIVGVVVQIQAEFTQDIEIKEVKLNLKELVIEQNFLHINKYEYVREKVSEYLNISKDLIFVYGY